MNPLRPWLAPCLLATLSCGTAQAADDEDLALAYGDAATVSIATGSKQSLRRAPAVASVFTAEDIRAMGASDLSQVLERVPGLHIGKSFYLFEPRYHLRGIGTDLNQQILILIDGVRCFTPTLGGPDEAWVDMPVDQIARIEVIRGPGSALFGADAFSGVIAISTWRGHQRSGLRVQGELGSQASSSLSLMHGGEDGPLRWHSYLRVGRTDGPDGTISADAQTALDALFGTRVSLAPGQLHNPNQAFDARLTVGWSDWELLASFKSRRHLGSGPGLASALTQRDRVDVRRAVLALSYQRADWQPGWDLEARVSYSDFSGNTDFQLYPPGAFGGAFPEGMVGTPGRSTRVVNLEGVSSFHGWRGQRLRLGFGLQEIDVHETHESKNFNFVIVPGIGPFPVPLGSVVDVSQSNPYMRPQRRSLRYLLVQHEWQFAQDWTLTTGVRHDRYSDFGNTTNPRMALVWDARHDLTLKALYGRAFRAPSFAELYTLNNPVQLGNPNLVPERLVNTELVANWQIVPTLHANLNLFRYRMTDILRVVPNADPISGSTNQNQGSQQGRGFEVEGHWQPHRTWSLEASYSQQRSTDALSGQDSGYSPRQMGKVGVHATLIGDWQASAQGWRIQGRRRAGGDLRPAIRDYSLLDLGLHWRREAGQGWQLSFMLRNALDADAREPSPVPGQIPFDYPLPGRNWQMQLRYTP